MLSRVARSKHVSLSLGSIYFFGIEDLKLSLLKVRVRPSHHQAGGRRLSGQVHRAWGGALGLGFLQLRAWEVASDAADSLL